MLVFVSLSEDVVELVLISYVLGCSCGVNDGAVNLMTAGDSFQPMHYNIAADEVPES